MLGTERQAFEHQVGVLCAGFNVPATSERFEAYWKGLGKMQLGTFERIVEHALGEEGPDKIPTSQQCWTIHRKLRQDQRERERAPQQTAIVPERDTLHCHGQRVMLSFLRHQTCGASQASLLRMIAAKNKLIEQYRWITQDEPEAAGELRDKLWEAFAAAWEPRTQADTDHDADVYDHTRRVPDFTEAELAHLRAGTAP